MCGNGIRGFAKLCYERRYVPAGMTTFLVATGAGVLTVTVFPDGDRVTQVAVDMGEPRFTRGEIPMAGPPDQECTEELVEVGADRLRVTAVSMGNPHAVTFVDDVDRAPVRAVGPRLERDPIFPHRANVEFVQVLGRDALRMRVWERGSGETLACGTGACAALVAAARTGRTGRSATVHLRGGDLEIAWQPDNHLFMTGPTAVVYSGIFNPE
jgi:diaminopimelate epimerase